MKEVKAQGTFYSVIKPLEKAAVEAAPSLTRKGWGKIIPVGDEGEHGYLLAMQRMRRRITSHEAPARSSPAVTSSEVWHAATAGMASSSCLGS